MTPPITAATVTVMRSHDYCHFSVSLSTNLADYTKAVGADAEIKCVDDLRKTAARLADKAVEQYKIAKRRISQRENSESDHNDERNRIEQIMETPEAERTPEEIAELKAARDDAYWQSRLRPYDYEDDYEEYEP